MIINMLWIVGLPLAGWSARMLYSDIKTDVAASRRAKRQEREDDEVLRIVSGLTEDDEPEVAVESEKITPSLRERFEDWWTQLWLDSTPRTGEQVAKEGFRPTLYAGRHRAKEVLSTEGGEDGLPVPEEEVLRRDRGQDRSGPRSQNVGLVQP
jgi:hypothetical protein